MDPKDEGKGFKGLGKLGGSQPPPPPPVAPGPPELPRPVPIQDPPPAAGSGGGGPTFTPPPKGSSGCLKVAVILVGMLLAFGLLSVVLGRLFGSADEPTSYTPPADSGFDSASATEAEALLDAAALEADPVEAARLAAEEAEAAQERARIAACRIDAGSRPENGEVLVRNLGEGGHHLKINGGIGDSLIKVRQDGATALAFYVRSFETVEIPDLPDGTYQVMFAGGSDFSRSCVEFTTGMTVSADPEPLVMAMTEQDGGSYYSVMEYTLQQQAGGNFEPEYVDPADFRD